MYVKENGNDTCYNFYTEFSLLAFHYLGTVMDRKVWPYLKVVGEGAGCPSPCFLLGSQLPVPHTVNIIQLKYALVSACL
jgi:hypothetical protein